MISVADIERLYPPDPSRKSWTWDDEEEDILSRLCLCCGQPGHYQAQLEAHITKHGLDQGICIHPDGKIDGHHRIVAARRLSVEMIPLEDKEAAGVRYLSDHGPVAWGLRVKGDVARGHESELHRRLWDAYDRIATLTIHAGTQERDDDNI